MPEKKIVIAGGGTGGHLYPGIALAKELRRRGFDPVFFLREMDLGKEILDREGFSYFEIPAMGFPRGISPDLARLPFVTVSGIFRTFSLLRDLRPCAVAGMGAYVSFPAVISAALLNIPSLIHEQNAAPGLTNRILARFARRIAVSFERSASFFTNDRTAVTGNPVRTDLFRKPTAATYQKLGLTEGKFTVLVFGGSQGAAALNRIAPGSYALLGGIRDKIQFLVITGQKDHEAARNEFMAKQVPGNVIPYAHEMGDAYAVAELIICRAGATTLAELRMLNKRAVLIPFSRAAANHQELNARAFASESGAEVVLEKEITPENMAAMIVSAFNSGIKPAEPNLPKIFPQELLANEVVSLCG